MASKKEVWKEFADEINAQYKEGTAFSQPFAIYKYKGFEIIFTRYIVSTGNAYVTYTTVYVPFKNKKEIKFKLTKKNFLHRIFKKSNKKIIVTGQSEFDYSYRIKGNDEIYIARLFSDYELQELIFKQKQMFLSINDNKGYHKRIYKEINKKREMEGDVDIAMLYYQCANVIKDKQRLYDLKLLFEKLVDKMVDLNMMH